MDKLTPKPYVFVLMPFGKNFDDVYQLGIKAACEEVGAYCERVDEQIFAGSILERIYNQIEKADVVVSDMTGRNPNVFYETGYAHARAKHVILLTQNVEDIPFDLKHHAHLIYGGSIVNLKSELVKRLGWAIDHPQQTLSSAEPALEFFGAGTRIEDGAVLLFPDFSLRVDVHNPATRTSGAGRVQIALVTELSLANMETRIGLPDGRFLYPFPQVDEIFPDGWVSTKLYVSTGTSADYEQFTLKGVPATIRITTEISVREIPIHFRLGVPRSKI